MKIAADVERVAVGTRMSGRVSQVVPFKQRFWAKVQKGPACWTWIGGTTRGGYGQIYETESGQMRRAPRVAWEMAHGPIPEGMSVLHSCDTPSCIRVEHLFLGTQRDNIADMVAKGRQACGERQGHARLTSEQVTEIKALIGHESQSAIARRFNVGQPAVSRIATGQRWSTVKSVELSGEPEKGKRGGAR